MGLPNTPQNGSDVEPLVLFEDEPTFTHSDDKLDLLHYANIIAATALGTRGPLAIGVFGTWGTGKTSLLRQAMSLPDAQKRPDVVTVWFNARQ